MDIQLYLDPDITPLLTATGSTIEENVYEMIVFELFRRGQISSGKGSELLQIDRLQFIHRGGELGIPYFHLDSDDWEEEQQNAAQL